MSRVAHDDRIRHVSHLMLLSSHGYTTIIPRRIAKFFTQNKKNNEMGMWTVGDERRKRLVKDRDAELRMEWDSDYTIAVAEYSS